MQITAERFEFAPPAEPAAVRGFVLAVIAHLLLMLALTWGISWNHGEDNVVAEAELWSAVPRQAAPPPPPVPQVVQAPPIVAPPVVKPPPAPPINREPDIALEQEKRKQQLARQRELQLEQEQERKLAAQHKADDQKKLEARHKQEELKKADLKKQQLAEQRAAELAAEKASEAKRHKADEAKAAAKAKLDAAQLEKMRKENIARMMKGLEGGTGATGSQGTADHASGTSAGYGSRVQARVRPYIVYPEDMPGNPQAEVEVRCSPDGTIVGTRITKPSGSKSWDDAVLAALAKAQVMPRDENGKVPTPLTIVFKRRP